MIININDLRVILSRDPDGQSERPTPERYAFFKRFVVGNFGLDVFHSYMAGELNSSPHNDNGTSDDFHG